MEDERFAEIERITVAHFGSGSIFHELLAEAKRAREAEQAEWLPQPTEPGWWWYYEKLESTEPRCVGLDKNGRLSFSDEHDGYYCDELPGVWMKIAEPRVPEPVANSGESRFYTSEGYCGHCKCDRQIRYHDSGHERDSSGDYKFCLTCGWMYSNGKWLMVSDESKA